MSVILYYSGALEPNKIQQNIDLSLGGNISSSPIPNDFFNNLFSTISEKAIAEGRTETKGIFLKNETGATITTITLYTDSPVDTISKYEWAAVTVPDDESMEEIQNLQATPFVATFVEAEGVANKITLVGSLDDNKVIGIWVKRIVDIIPPVDCNDLQAYLDGLNKDETIDVVIEWT